MISTIMTIIVTIAFVGFLFFGPKASENIIEKTIELREFDAVEIGISSNITIKKGPTHSIKIKSHENIISAIETTIENEILTLEFTKKFMNIRVIDIELTTPKLIGIGIEGVDATVQTDHYKADTFYVNATDYCKITVDVDANKIISRIKAKGSATFKGNANIHDIIAEGELEINAFDLNTKESKVVAYQSGFFHLSVSEKLDVVSGGIGNVVYRGNPEVKSEMNNTGKLLKRKK